MDQSSSVVVHRSQCIDSCHNMASSGIESDAAEQKDDIQKSPDDEICQAPAKRLKISDSSLENADHAAVDRKKKVVMLLVYSGKGYLGMQRNPGFKTVESELFDALVRADVVRPDHIEQPGLKMAFQRAARTDKGVSAAGQVVSLKMLIGNDCVVDNINSHLPDEIRVLGIKRVTKGFDSKNYCDSRTYCYITPTFAFAPAEEIVTESYRITADVRQQVSDILNLFTGTHNFHNFTSGKKPDEASAKRYITEFKIGEPFEWSGLEFVALTVRGQSFMLHQIRKMIGLTIAIMRGFTDMKYMDDSWKAEKVDVPKAPGLGLMLEQVHYDGYNKKYGCDGLHEEITWDEYKNEIEDFKQKYIYPTIFTTEQSDKSMMKWLGTLSYHNYEVLPPGSEREPTAVLKAHKLLKDESEPETSLPVQTDSDCTVDKSTVQESAEAKAVDGCIPSCLSQQHVTHS